MMDFPAKAKFEIPIWLFVATLSVTAFGADTAPRSLNFADLLSRAEAGDKYACFQVGRDYVQGKGTKVDYAEGRRWSQLAADQGVPNAMCLLGYLYDYGLGVAQSPEEAFSWFAQGALHGDPYGQEMTAGFYKDGVAVAQDDDLALFWYKKAVSQGYPPRNKSWVNAFLKKTDLAATSG